MRRLMHWSTVKFYEHYYYLKMASALLPLCASSGLVMTTKVSLGALQDVAVIVIVVVMVEIAVVEVAAVVLVVVEVVVVAVALEIHAYSDNRLY